MIYHSSDPPGEPQIIGDTLTTLVSEGDMINVTCLSQEQRKAQLKCQFNQINLTKGLNRGSKRSL